MSLVPRKYHGPEIKCGGVGMCRDCTEKAQDKLPSALDEVLNPSLTISYPPKILKKPNIKKS